MSDWGLPDWRDEKAYAVPSNAHIFYWKWQFTRRREDYRAAWGEAWEHKHPELKRRAPDTAAHPDSGKYGMFYLANPALPEYSKGTFQPLPGTSEHHIAEYDDFMARRDEGFVSIEFDLTKPVKEQLERAGKVLAREAREYGAKERRQHVVKWPTYLRVLDAREDGQTWDTIAHEVLKYTRNEPQAAKQVWDAARQLMFNFPA